MGATTAGKKKMTTIEAVTADQRKVKASELVTVGQMNMTLSTNTARPLTRANSLPSRDFALSALRMRSRGNRAQTPTPETRQYLIFTSPTKMPSMAIIEAVVLVVDGAAHRIATR